MNRRVALGLLVAAAAASCGETRMPVGEECLRSDDCLSGVCAARTCVAAPPVYPGSGAPPPPELPRIPVNEAGADASTDGPDGG